MQTIPLDQAEGHLAVLRTDWLIALLLFILQSALYGLGQSGVSLGVFTRGLTVILPPFQAAFLGGGGLPTYPAAGELAHALLYGAGLVAGAVAVLVYRPLGSGGRA